jgi:hypothetical protein
MFINSDDSTFSGNTIISSKLIREKDHLYLTGVPGAIPQYRLVFRIDVSNRVDVPVFPVRTEMGKTFYYGTDGTFCYYYYEEEVDHNKKREKYPTTPAKLHSLNGVWTIQVLVHTRKRYNISLYMEVDVAKEFIPDGHVLVFVDNTISYRGEYWTILSEVDYERLKHRFTSPEMVNI